ncbi:hypothetical protein, partial [Paraherbaspirillum soli]
PSLTTTQTERVAMPFLGIGLHVLVALFFAIHALKTGRQIYWLIILFSFPLLGSIAYFFVEYLPSSGVDRGIKNVTSLAVKTLDPSKALRTARAAFELTPTVQNRIHLANALLESNATAEAAEQFDICLQGPFANDPEIRFGAAKVKFLDQKPTAAIQLLTMIMNSTPGFRAEEVSLLLARAYAAAGDHHQAQQHFTQTVNNYGGIESRAEYAIWAASTGDLKTAAGLRAELEQTWKHWPKHARSLHKPLFRRVDAAIEAAKGSIPK